MTDAADDPSLFAPVVCLTTGHRWRYDPARGVVLECRRCGTIATESGRRNPSGGISPRDLVLAVTVAGLVGAWLTVGFVMFLW
ncbi:hypothetical protein ACFQPA_04120 [Halomarina halobia]|uniref:Uncharacterized protein n=1 Tax=Halomarina halobia TaxID=3033386 RepID=A0ABD6A5W4_9EURY|nr:hypothetical protein [Halomarina sp. PSR21]